MRSKIATFADDTKLFQLIRTREDCEVLQRDLYKLGEWVTQWQIKFSVAKVK